MVYLYVGNQQTIYFIFAFPKNVQGNLTDAQKKTIRKIVTLLKAEEWPRKWPRK